MKKIIISFIAAISFLIVPLLKVGEAYIIDKVEAVVNGKVITKSEVDKSLEVEALKEKEAGKQPSPELREAVLKTLIDRTLLLEEARKFNIASVTYEEVQKAYERVKAGFPDEAAFTEALKKEEITPEELKKNLRDQLLAANYVENRIKFFVRVTLDDEKDYYEENAERFGGRPFAEVQEEIHSLLIEKETGKKLEEYLRELKTKAKITFPGRGGKQESIEIH